ncbi:MAG: hypothetical protein AAGH15_06265 [Myxococcota bacterium]
MSDAKKTVDVAGASRTIDLEDVDDIIGLAAELREREAVRLDLADLREVAEEVGIEARYVEPALEALRDRRAAEAAANQEEAARRRRLGRGLGVALGVAAALALLMVGRVASHAGTLEEAHVPVERSRAQLVNVRERQQAVEARLHAATPDPERAAERDAERAGAENRVRIERRRYDEAAATYNGEARGLVGEWAAAWAGLPREVPMSDALGEAGP